MSQTQTSGLGLGVDLTFRVTVKGVSNTEEALEALRTPDGNYLLDRNDTKVRGRRWSVLPGAMK